MAHPSSCSVDRWPSRGKALAGSDSVSSKTFVYETLPFTWVILIRNLLKAILLEDPGRPTTDLLSITETSCRLDFQMHFQHNQ